MMMVFLRNDIHLLPYLVLIVERYYPRIRTNSSRVNFTKRIPAAASRSSKLSFREKRGEGPSSESILSRNGIKKWVSRIVLTNKSLSRTVSEAPWTGPRLRDRWVSLGHGVLRHGESFAGPRGAAAWRQRYATRERGNPRAEDDAER